MKCTECNNTLHKTIGEFSMSIDGKTIKVINAPILHCKNCDLVVVDDEIKNMQKNSQKYIYPIIFLIMQNAKLEL